MTAPAILLFEDDTLLREMLALQLTSAGYRVVQAANAANLEQLASTEQPALLITDLVMPEAEGMQAIFTAHSHYSFPVIAMSAHSGFLGLAEGLVAATLRKPFPPERLLQLVAQVLEARQ